MNRDVHSLARECPWRDSATLHSLGGLTPADSQAYLDHLPRCGACSEELESAQKTVARVDASACDAALAVTDLSAAPRVRERLLERLASESRAAIPQPHLDRTWQRWSEPRDAGSGLHSVAAAQGEWEPIGIDGIEVKRLSVDPARRYVTMLVRMAPGSAYPGHRHADAEECYVISGDLRVGERVLREGDYQVAAAGSTHGVQSTERGCTLFIVSSQDDQLV